MGFVESVKTVLMTRYAKFSGRASRSEYWWFVLFYFLVSVSLVVLAILVSGGTPDQWANGNIPMGSAILFVLLGIFVLATIIPYVAVTVRRLHDRNISGWWYVAIFVISLIPFLNIIGAIGSLVFLVICCLRGTNGPNKYGPDPLAGYDAEVFR